MSAVEIIEQLKTLPDEEVAAVREFLLRDEDSFSPARVSFEEAADHVFAKHGRVLQELAK